MRQVGPCGAPGLRSCCGAFGVYVQRGCGARAEVSVHRVRGVRRSADSGVEVPVYTLEFDIGVEGDHESVLALVASLTTAASRVSSSQLQAAAEESSDSSKGEARRVRWVSLGAFKPLHAVGKALSRFVLAHVLQYRACKQQQQQREEAGADSDKARSPRLAAQLQQQPRTALRLQQLQQQLAAVGLSGCHLPLLILKPRYVVQRHRRQDSSKSKNKQQTGSQARSSQELKVQILPLLPQTETMEKNKKQKYTGPTARPLQYDSAQLQILKLPMSQGFPVILFRFVFAGLLLLLRRCSYSSKPPDQQQPARQLLQSVCLLQRARRNRSTGLRVDS